MNFTLDTVIYTYNDTGQSVFRDSKTVGYMFINTGSCPVLLNNYLLPPNSSLKTFEPMCEDMTVYRMNFKPNNYWCTQTNSELTVLIYNKV